MYEEDELYSWVNILEGARRDQDGSKRRSQC